MISSTTSTSSYKDLETLRVSIESMDIFHQKEILKILASHKNEVTLNENKNGVLINLTDISKNIIEEITKYISHVNTQETELNDDEETKLKLKNDFFKVTS